jgi:hypothetical protein
VKNTRKISQLDGSVSNISTNINWQQQIVAGNDAMAKELFFTAYNHYKIALVMAKKIFITHQNQDNVPDHVIPAIVVSYLNICKLWEKQNKTTARKSYLCAVFDYLVVQLLAPNLASGTKEQLWSGLDKVYMEMIEMGDTDILVLKKDVLKTL